VILLDTCAVIWDALEPNQLTPKAKNAIERYQNELIVCDISIWEIAMLIRKDRLVVESTTSGFIRLLLEARNFQVQEITAEIAELSVNFGPEISNDPADRLIAATSVLCNAPVVSADQNLRRSAMVETIW
jgi:PIN domain nuclease of toxin-antitoxin system